MSAMEDYDMTEADADVEDEPTLSPNGRVRGQRHHAAHGLRPRQRSQRGSFASDTPDDLDPDADTKHSSPRSTPKQRRSSSSSDAGKRSRGGGGLGGGGGGHGRKKSGTVDVSGHSHHDFNLSSHPSTSRPPTACFPKTSSVGVCVPVSQ